jgi:hypothetical protein
MNTQTIEEKWWEQYQRDCDQARKEEIARDIAIFSGLWGA